MTQYQPRMQNNLTTATSLGYGSSETPYTDLETGFISTIVAAAFLSAISVLILVSYTYIPALFGSLLASNLLQSVGTLINLRWVLNGGVLPGKLCGAQGGIKHAGNVGTAVWSFALALHAFRLLFLRTRVARRIKWLALALGWLFVTIIVSIGPLALQRKDRGPYFGLRGTGMCWITHEYPVEQTLLEYVIEWTSAFVSFVLYVIVLLRVRGNLIKDSEGRWFLRWVSRNESWQLAFARDYLDSCTIKMVAIVVWYPVTYTILIVPISIARFASYAGAPVPVSFTFMADTIFALGGFVNLLLFLSTRRFIPDLQTTPDFSTPRSRPSKGQVLSGVTPFVFTSPEVGAQPVMMTVTSGRHAPVSWFDRRPEVEALNDGTSVGSPMSDTSQESRQPLNYQKETL
ncbi:hypothetical protein EDB86DRAFT_3074815 [Lactarius hatsudake]|nr:hypothetical protein EDB86DRAFT_3074815 [Lactarius hatsudake]